MLEEQRRIYRDDSMLCGQKQTGYAHHASSEDLWHSAWLGCPACSLILEVIGHTVTGQLYLNFDTGALMSNNKSCQGIVITYDQRHPLSSRPRLRDARLSVYVELGETYTGSTCFIRL